MVAEGVEDKSIYINTIDNYLNCLRIRRDIQTDTIKEIKVSTSSY